MTPFIDTPVIYAMYALSIMLVMMPVVDILLARRIRTRFPILVAAVSFLALNLLGSVSPNILARHASIEYPLIHLVTATFLFVWYFAGPRLHQSRGDLNRRLVMAEWSARGVYPTLLLLLLAVSISSVIAFSLAVAIPTLLRIDLYGDWAALVAHRTGIVFGPHRFHWFALTFVHIPLFASILVSVLFHAHRTAGTAASVRNWRILLWATIPVCAVLSVLFLHKTFVAYLIFGLALVNVILNNRIPFGRTFVFTAAIGSVLYLLYFTYMGFDPALVGLITEMLLHRIFEVYAWAAAVAVDLYPGTFPYLHGTSMINLFGAFSYEQVNVAEQIYPYIYGTEFTGKGSAPLPAIFESYVNFGWVGVVASLVIIAGVLALLTRMAASDNPFVFSLSIFLTLFSIRIWESPFWFGALEPTLVVLVVFLFFCYGAVRELAKSPRLLGRTT